MPFGNSASKATPYPRRIPYVSEREFEAHPCLCGEYHARSEYIQLPCRLMGGVVERSYRCPRGRIVSWCKTGPAGITYGKL